MPKRILFIVNPISGRMRSKAGMFEILDELYRDDRTDLSQASTRLPLYESERTDTSTDGGNTVIPDGYVTPRTVGGDPVSGRRVTVIPTMYRGHATTLSAAAYSEGYDEIICCGGDGTLNEVVTGLLTQPLEQRLPLGYIPAGSTNDFASSLGLPSSLRDAARVAVGRDTYPLDIGLFSSCERNKRAERPFCYIASFGIFTAASYTTPQTAKNALGHLAYVLEGAKDLTKIQAHHATLQMDGDRVAEGDYIFGAVTNTTSAGGIFKLPAGSVSMSDGEFEVFLVRRPRTLAEMSRLTAALLAADFGESPLIEFYHASTVRVTLPYSLSWSLDGEEADGGTEVFMRCLPRAIRVKSLELPPDGRAR